MSHYRPATTPKAAIADALIEAELVIERRVGEALIDAEDVLDALTLSGWAVVYVGEPRPNPDGLNNSVSQEGEGAE